MNYLAQLRMLRSGRAMIWTWAAALEQVFLTRG